MEELRYNLSNHKSQARVTNSYQLLVSCKKKQDLRGKRWGGLDWWGVEDLASQENRDRECSMQTCNRNPVTIHS